MKALAEGKLKRTKDLYLDNNCSTCTCRYVCSPVATAFGCRISRVGLELWGRYNECIMSVCIKKYGSVVSYVW